MSKRNNYIVHIFISTKKSLEEVEERTLDRMKFNWRKNSAGSWITQVPDSYADEDDCANAAERALARVEEWRNNIRPTSQNQYYQGLEDGIRGARSIIKEELAKYHGE